MPELKLEPALSARHLMPGVTVGMIETLQAADPNAMVWVAEIDPAFAGGTDFCDHYGVSPLNGANCVIVEGKRGDNVSTAACMTPVGYRIDFNGAVRRHLGARRVSMASAERTLEESQMEYGSVTPVGLPSEWHILIDSRIVLVERLFIGGGLKNSKLCLPGALLERLPNAAVIEDLASAPAASA